MVSGRPGGTKRCENGRVGVATNGQGAVKARGRIHQAQVHRVSDKMKRERN